MLDIREWFIRLLLVYYWFIRFFLQVTEHELCKLHPKSFRTHFFVFQSKEERILELETENALLHLRLAEVRILLTSNTHIGSSLAKK